MQGTYTPWLVQLSIAVAVIVSYTALNLTSRLANSHARGAWLAGGTVAMGVGIWSVHCIGILALSLPIELTYSLPINLLSLVLAVLTAGFALFIVSGHTLSHGRLAAGALATGAGIAAMHYCGMASIRIAPTITYEPGLFATSIAAAIATSYVALLLAFRLRRGRSGTMVTARIVAALVMGASFSGMHYIGMAAARFSPDAHSLPGARLDNAWFAITLGIFALGIMAVTLLTVVYDSRLRRHLRTSHEAIETAHAHARNASRSDALTGLPNRVAFLEAAEQAIGEASRKNTQLAVMVLDVDRLNSINDSLGHQVGDELLLELARRLQSVLRHNDMVARLDSDKFTVLATDLRSARDAEGVAGKVLEALQQPFMAENVSIHPSVSIGISTFPLDGDTFDVLLRRAIAAMRHTKEAARGSYRFYSSEMNSFNDDRLALESELRRALAIGEFELHYQPKVDIATNRIRSAEALIRWHHPTRGLVAPNVFIPVAEETGLIVPLGEWVLRQACMQARRWLDCGMMPLRIAVNLSAKQFRHADLAAVVKSALDDAGLEPGHIELELTESAVMHDPEQSTATLQALSAMGVHISIDDFGTGYSSLSYLRRFPLDKLKIDRSFIRDLMSDLDNASIVKAIISLAHSLRLRVVAEGVETAEQLEFLREAGCDQYQGFFCSPAVPAEAFASLVTRLRAERPELTEADMLRTQSRLSAFTPEAVR